MPTTSTISAATPELVHHLGTFPAPHQTLWRDRRAAERTWRAPVLAGREEVLAAQDVEARAALDQENVAAVSIVGPRGAGTTSVAECAVATFAERSFGRRSPLVLRVDVSQCRTPGLLVKALFRQLDPNFQGQGASTEFLSMFLVRRLRTLGRPAVVWIDQAHSSGEFGRVVRALARPEEVLPEGAAGLPPLLLLVSGSRAQVPEEIGAVQVQVPPLQGPCLLEAIRVRAALSFHTHPTQPVLRAFADLATASGHGLSFVGDLLTEAGARAEARGSNHVALEDVVLPKGLPRHGADAEGSGRSSWGSSAGSRERPRWGNSVSAWSPGARRLGSAPRQQRGSGGTWSDWYGRDSCEGRSGWTGSGEARPWSPSEPRIDLAACARGRRCRGS